MEPTGKTSEEVKIPKLELNRQNWKIYHAKIIEAAATDITNPLGVLAGWELDDGSHDWECLDAILKWTFYTSVPISILHPIRKLDTVHEVFNYLTKRFRNPNPIVDPCATSANEAKRGMDENSNAEPKQSPTSTNAATEWHANAKLDEEDLSTTKDLSTRGMEDPRTSREASAEGNSMECADGTPVLLTGTPHETQNEPQNSLRATAQRLPIEGEPCECEQEAVNGVVTAECTNGMVERAEPTVVDADVDRMALLGGEPAERASGVDEGDGTERGYQAQLQQTGFYCEESRQRSGNATEDIPSAQKLPLEGEWSGYASGEASNPKVDGIESEGCEGGMSECACVDEANGNPSREVEPADTSNESETLVTLSVELYVEDGGDIPHVYLGGTRWRACHIEGLGNRADTSRYQLDGSRGLTDGSGGLTDASNASNSAEMAVISQGEGGGTYLHAGGAKRKPDEPAGCGNHSDTSDARMDMQSVGYERETAENETESVSTHQADAQTRNSPYTVEIETAMRTYQWRRVSVEDVDIYLPWNTPIVVPRRRIVFGEAESGDEAIAPRFEGEGAGKGNGDRNGDGGDDGGDGDEGGTTSGSSVDSVRVNSAQLAVKSQYMRQGRRT